MKGKLKIKMSERIEWKECKRGYLANNGRLKLLPKMLIMLMSR
jgi:hypothetical protein